MIEITADSVLTGLEAVVDEFGEGFVYQRVATDYGSGCFYVKNGEPDCIVAKFLTNLGVELHHLEFGDSANFGTAVAADELLERLEGFEVLKSSSRARYALRAAQRAQDSGHTWGDALSVAEQTLKGEINW